MAIEELKSKRLRWINITNPRDLNSPEIKYLKKNFHFHPLNLQDCIVDGQRPKLDLYHDHLFLVLLYPLYNRRTGEVESAEIDFFVCRDFIITVHNSKLEILERYFNHLKKARNEKERNDFLSSNVIVVMYELLNKLIFHCFPMLDHISLDIHRAEKHIFEGREKEMVSDILSSRRNIVNFRKTMQAHKSILKKLEHANHALGLFEPEKADTYFNSLVDRTKDIWDTLESFKESIEALHDTNESLISFRLNQIMKAFTVISVVIFILTLVATLFGMGAQHTPFTHRPFGFWIVFIIEVLVAFAVVTIFKRRHWLK